MTPIPVRLFRARFPACCRCVFARVAVRLVTILVLGALAFFDADHTFAGSRTALETHGNWQRFRLDDNYFPDFGAAADALRLA
jgi:hypothetical protein